MSGELFKDAINESCFTKIGIHGFSGSGKSFTAMLIAIGLHKYILNKKPIFYLDSETGSDFLLSRFQENKIDLKVCKSRAFIDLLQSVDIAEEKSNILIIDSITHYWNELWKSYQKKKQLSRLTIRHWADIKAEWYQFSEKFINSKLHIIMCGRAGFEWDYFEDEEGVKELTKVGTKLKCESELAYEPSLMLEMERVKTKKGKIGSDWINRCWVLKDRFDKINGNFFDNPTFENFLPHIQMLNLGGKHIGVDTRQDSQQLFDSNKSASERYKQREILLEEIQSEVILKFGRSDEAKKARITTLRNVFGTASWSAISNIDLEKLKKGLEKLKKIKEAK